MTGRSLMLRLHTRWLLKLLLVPMLVLTGELPHTGFAGAGKQWYLLVQSGRALSMSRVDNVSLKGI